MFISLQVHCALPASIVLTIPLTRRPVDRMETESGVEGHNSDPSADDDERQGKRYLVFIFSVIYIMSLYITI